MSDQSPSARAQKPARGARRVVPGLTACRLCAGETLGQADTHPGGQLERVCAIAASGDARLTVVDCLDACERGDVLVARPVPAVRAAQPPIWFERLAGDGLTTELHSWLRAGGPGVAPLPARLSTHVIHPQQPLSAEEALTRADASIGA
ncbi:MULTISPECIES: hypothetical protein [Cellulosimicrobium]|uniref:hypothetical protein n=1 Tax=Cellulosimicrobium TaxID=157920 RepID=UPI001BA8047E|nr:hypothetical protein [Cellulosimicrobium cellulans]QUC01951.1 hypothetical protein J5A69_19380 [Cellulosimicrobium cellulans]